MHVLRSAAVALGLVGLLAPATAHADPIILEPPNGAVVPPQFAVKVSCGEVEACDTDGCYFEPAESVHLSADGMPLNLSSACPPEVAEFAVMLAPGEHELSAIAEAGFSIAHSDPIKVTVEEDTTDTTGTSDGTDSDASPTSGSSTTSNDATSAGSSTSSSGSTDPAGDTQADSDPGQKDGCACDVEGSPRHGLAWLTAGFLAIILRRRAR